MVSTVDKSLKVYIAGKVSKESIFGTHDWRDEFCRVLEKLSKVKLVNIDPTKSEVDQMNPQAVFGADALMISRADVVIVYLSDDISVGGSQEMLIAKYFKKPLIGLAPFGGKFNGSTKEYFNKIVENYQDPFVFSTCDIVCKDIEEVAKALRNVTTMKPKSIELIDDLVAGFEDNYLENTLYLREILKDEN